ncbi:hypothetical protein EJ05DRAFT_494324 [Pseudovirgaria hyperparasitica]|uniref:3-hydroxyisobutyrate dehydrogenase n=1 Tax=Pseudovirgaria hyperparasitica TaxID=470096 RepID=A0A6A6VYS4_9PEZI|nr:uncharacterized protein EJ05DRAFT_494324 [Pseudovirgaria hyperparasitica]KAF2754830.1 hypothetical protein EJ05DRAFT_494324 [Pseudovirgaria hyperparasitica]
MPTHSDALIVNQLLVGVHIAAAAEAMALAARAGLNTREVYEVVRHAAGNSAAFEKRVPLMLDGHWSPLSALNSVVEDMRAVTAAARRHNFPVPLASAAEQLCIAGLAQGFGRDDDAGLVRTFLPGAPSLVHDQSRRISLSAEPTPSTTPKELAKVGFVGLGTMGQGMAASLIRAGLPVHGYDLHRPALEKFLANGKGAVEAGAPADAARHAQLFILMVQNAAQVEDVLFGSGAAVESLPQGATVMLMSTVAPSFAKGLQERLVAAGKDLDMVDAPVSGGVARAANGNLTIICSGNNTAFPEANTAIAAMSGTDKNVYRVQGGAGAASAVKLINQLLAGVHIAAAAEAMAFGAKLGLNTRDLFATICNSTGHSWMFENRVPAMLSADWTPHSALAIFVKDLGIVLDEAKRLSYSAPLSAVAHQLYLFGASSGWTSDADAGVVRVWEKMAGVNVSSAAASAGSLIDNKDDDGDTDFIPREYPALPADDLLASLPPPYPHPEHVLDTIRRRIASKDAPVLVVLDDDPTGTQTCHDIAVLTVWDHETLLSEFRTGTTGFFILTNSRALPTDEATALITTITRNVAAAAAAASSRPFNIVLRGDSTLRGHMPAEPDAVESVLGPAHAWILAPFFLQGGRLTINNIHYVHEPPLLVPASHTPFAQDASFGYRSSNLQDYVREKCGPRFDDAHTCSISIETLRTGGPAAVTAALLAAPPRSVILVNAVAESDMFVFAAGLLNAEATGKRYLYRTAAAFISARLAITPIAPLTPQDLGIDTTSASAPGGLIVAGSYVPKTTAQLARLRERRGARLAVLELDAGVLSSHVYDTSSSSSFSSSSSSPAFSTAAESLIATTISQANTLLSSGGGVDVLVMTSRTLLSAPSSHTTSLRINRAVATALERVVRGVHVRPRYVVAKGGITASGVATVGLGMRRAVVVGQVGGGVPVWRLRHRGVPVVVFPGNVGGVDMLADLVARWGVE